MIFLPRHTVNSYHLVYDRHHQRCSFLLPHSSKVLGLIQSSGFLAEQKSLKHQIPVAKTQTELVKLGERKLLVFIWSTRSNRPVCVLVASNLVRSRWIFQQIFPLSMWGSYWLSIFLPYPQKYDWLCKMAPRCEWAWKWTSMSSTLYSLLTPSIPGYRISHNAHHIQVNVDQ